MEPARWHRIEALLQAALDLPREKRPAFLTSECGSDELLRGEVSALLAFESNGAILSDSPVVARRTPPALLTGRTISHYRIEERIGAGGMGEIYRARDETLQRTVAIKALPPEVSAHRFEQEALAASRLNHPNIVTIFEILHDGGAHFIVTEHIEGKSLRALLAEPIPVEKALDVAMQIAAALKAAHTAWIIHRDVKPENIMVRDDGLVKLVDFGIAKLNEEPSAPLVTAARPTPAGTNLTIPGAVLGTARYMSPEQARGDPLDGRTDLYSLGLVLREMLDSRNEELQQIVRRLLRADRDERYSTAGELLDDLEYVRRRVAGRTTRRLLGLSALTVAVLVVCIGIAALLSINESWDERVLRDGHAAAARQAVFSPDGRRLLTCGEDGQVILWDFVRRERMATFPQKAHKIAYAPDGRWFATGGTDGRLIVWDAQRRTPARVFTDIRGEITALKFSDDGRRLAAASELQALLWDTESWKPLIAGTNGSTHGTFIFTTRGQFATTLGWTVHDTETGAELTRHATLWANWFALSPDETEVAAIDGHGMVSFFRLAVPGDLRRLDLVAQNRAHQDHGRGIAYSPDGRLVASAAEDILLWDAQTRRKIARFESSAIVWSVAFSGDGRWLVSTHGDGGVIVWDVVERERVANLSEHSAAVRAVAFSPGGTRIASGGEDRAVTVWDLRGQKQAVLNRHRTRVTAVAFSPDGREILSTDQDGTAIVWDLASRRPRVRVTSPDLTPSYAAAISPDGRFLATSAAVYARDGRLVNHHYPARAWPYAQTYGTAYSPDGTRLAAATSGGWVLLADAVGRILDKRQVAGSRLITVSYSRDGKWLATGEDEGAVRLWSVAPLREVAVLGRHSARVKSVAFAPDGKTVASAGDDKMIALWDVRRRKLRARIGTHASPVYAIAFSPDGRRLASGEHDHSVRLYSRKRTLWGFALQ